MSNEYSEDKLVEAAAQQVLEEMGWTVVTAWHKETFGHKGMLGREDRSEVVLRIRLFAALMKLNPKLPYLAYTHAIDKIIERSAGKTMVQLNKEKYTLLTQGVDVSFTNQKGELEKKKLRVFDFDNPEKNDFLAVRQLEVVGDLYNRRPDIVGFVNGIPLVFFELKAHHTDLRHAFEDNLRDYKDAIPHLFHHNALIILSNGTDARIGTITSPYKFFAEWKRIYEDQEGVVSMDTMLRGTCDKARLMDLFENFILFDASGGDSVKILAKNHQYLGVNKVLDQARNIDELKGKLGVFWHTQGSGKSYSMVFIAQKIHRKFGGSYTFLLVTDRTELERQLYDTFTGVGAVTKKGVIAGSKAGMSGREHLRELLTENHRYVFSLIHKFSIDSKLESEYPLITDRKNIIVISDEAHRTQAGTFARNMRFHGIPNASYLGFTGTPLIKEELELTKNIFGEYVSIYDFKRAIDDGATMPLRYLNRGEKLDIDNPELDEKMAELIESEDLDEDQRRKLEREFKRDYPVLELSELDAEAMQTLSKHFNERGYQGGGESWTFDPLEEVLYRTVFHDQDYIEPALAMQIMAWVVKGEKEPIWSALEPERDEERTKADTIRQFFTGYASTRSGHVQMTRALHVLDPETLNGCVWAELGYGTGKIFEAVREAVGPQGSIVGVELGSGYEALIERLSRHPSLNWGPITLVRGSEDDCGLPAESVDIVHETGIHVGMGSPETLERRTIPWLQSVKRAMRPGAIMVLDDFGAPSIDRVRLVMARAGLEEVRVEFFPTTRTDRTQPDFVAAFRKPAEEGPHPPDRKNH